MGIACRMPILPISIIRGFFCSLLILDFKSGEEIYSPIYSNKKLCYINITKYTADNEIFLLHISYINILKPINFLYVFD